MAEQEEAHWEAAAAHLPELQTQRHIAQAELHSPSNVDLQVDTDDVSGVIAECALGYPIHISPEQHSMLCDSGQPEHERDLSGAIEQTAAPPPPLAPAPPTAAPPTAPTTRLEDAKQHRVGSSTGSGVACGLAGAGSSQHQLPLSLQRSSGGSGPWAGAAVALQTQPMEIRQPSPRKTTRIKEAGCHSIPGELGAAAVGAGVAGGAEAAGGAAPAKWINQDRALMHPACFCRGFVNPVDLYGVFDGHGADGHHVAHFLAQGFSALIADRLAARHARVDLNDSISEEELASSVLLVRVHTQTHARTQLVHTHSRAWHTHTTCTHALTHKHAHYSRVRKSSGDLWSSRDRPERRRGLVQARPCHGAQVIAEVFPMASDLVAKD